MGSSKLRELSVEFSVAVLQFADEIKGHYSIVNQLERSATSIGANIHEANYAHSRADFKTKFEIALKECYETEYWLEILTKSGLADASGLSALSDRCGTIRRLLVASLTTLKNNS